MSPAHISAADCTFSSHFLPLHCTPLPPRNVHMSLGSALRASLLEIGPGRKSGEDTVSGNGSRWGWVVDMATGGGGVEEGQDGCGTLCKAL